MVLSHWKAAHCPVRAGPLHSLTPQGAYPGLCTQPARDWHLSTTQLEVEHYILVLAGSWAQKVPRQPLKVAEGLTYSPRALPVPVDSWPHSSQTWLLKQDSAVLWLPPEAGRHLAPPQGALRPAVAISTPPWMATL